MKADLDARYRPDGYNVGFNAGEAAGQTVGHLHIHVIPRRNGDVKDPRGGVRYVIPDKGNYLDPSIGKTAAPALIDARERRTLRLELARCLVNDDFDRIDLLVSFIMKSGLDLIGKHLDDAIERGARVRVLTTDYLRVTDADALARLLDLAESTAGGPGSLDVRVFSDPLTSFHPKAYLFSSSTHGAARGFVGSNNLSHSGIEAGIEWSLAVDAVEPLVRAFDELWHDRRSKPLDHDVLRAYRAVWTPHAGRVIAVGIETEAPTQPPQPKDIQSEALAALQRTRIDGHAAGLVVMATGLGKTWLGAFDSATFDSPGSDDAPPRVARTLFVAHREEILRQSRDVFRAVRPGADLGLLTGREKQPDAEVVFASIQTIARRLDEFDPDAFEYIVIDEFHHAAASSYRRLIDHFRPSFLLGLTATPDRMDGADLLALCGDNLVFDCGLVEGIDRSALVPFHYWGIKDVADFAPIPWRNGRFDPVLLAQAVETQQRAQQTFDEWQSRCGERTIGFCASVSHAEFMTSFFRERSVNAVAVHSGTSSRDRRDAIERLRRGELEILFSIDVFNEGVDVPEIDSVMMLRPTESPVVFLQQLGRGLRTSIGKSHLTVVDFVGNHESFLMKPRLLLALGDDVAPTNRQIVEALTTGEFRVPVGCSVSFELEAIDLLRRLAEGGKRSGIEAFCLEYARERGVRPTAVQAFRSGYNPRAARPKHRHWFAMLESIGLLGDDDAHVVARHGELLRSIEVEQATKSYKLVTLRALLAEGALRTGLSINDLAARAHRLVLADPRLVSDVTNVTAMPDPVRADVSTWRSFWLKWPLTHFTNEKSGGALFRIEGDRFVPTFTIAPVDGAAFDAMVEELVEWRLADYLLRSASVPANAIRCKVIQTNGRPIVMLDRSADPEIPTGDVVVLIDGERYVARFVKIAVNVLQREGENTNVLPDVLRSWFGPAAGQPGTAHAVLFESVNGQWLLRPA